MPGARDELDGAALTRWGRLCLDELRHHRDEINALNVFPVPDADTGTNMLATMRAAVRAAEAVDIEAIAPGDGGPFAVSTGETAAVGETEVVSVDEVRSAPGDAATVRVGSRSDDSALAGRSAGSARDVAGAMARAATVGARGNSGIILSQVLRGVAEAVAGGPLTAETLRDALRRSAVLVRDALSEPVEGTMLTVLDAAADRAGDCAENTLEAVALAAADGAAKGLGDTPSQLSVLRAAGVVDAGARGLLVLLDALVTEVTGEPPARQEYTASAPIPPGDATSGAPAGQIATGPAPAEDTAFESARAGDGGSGSVSAGEAASGVVIARGGASESRPAGRAGGGTGGCAEQSIRPGTNRDDESTSLPSAPAPEPLPATNAAPEPVPAGNAASATGSAGAEVRASAANTASSQAHGTGRPGESSEPVVGVISDVPTPLEACAPDADASGAASAAHPQYEVMYLLSGTDEDRIAGLRDSLARLGDSVVVVGDGAGTWSAHVHCADAGAAVEAGLAAGTPSRIRIERLASDRRPTSDRGILAVAAGAGAARLFEDGGALVLRGEVTTETLLSAIRTMPNQEVVVLPNGALPAHELVAVSVAARDGRREVLMLPSGSMVQGLAARALHDAGRTAAADVCARAAAAAATRWGALRVAPERALTIVGTCERGDALGLVGNDVVVIDPDLGSAARTLLERMLGLGGELVTLLLGADVPAGLGAALAEHIAATFPGVEVVTYDGGQPADLVQIGVE